MSATTVIGPIFFYFSSEITSKCYTHSDINFWTPGQLQEN